MEIEGLMKLREVSDAIAKEHGCKIIEDARLIGTHENVKSIPAYMIDMNAKYQMERGYKKRNQNIKDCEQFKWFAMKAFGP